MHGEYKMPGGKLIVADLEVRDGLLANVEISGDFFLEPDTALADMDEALEGLPATCDEGNIARIVETAMGRRVAMYGISAGAVAVAVQRALKADR